MAPSDDAKHDELVGLMTKLNSRIGDIENNLLEFRSFLGEDGLKYANLQDAVSSEIQIVLNRGLRGEEGAEAERGLGVRPVPPLRQLAGETITAEQTRGANSCFEDLRQISELKTELQDLVRKEADKEAAKEFTVYGVKPEYAGHMDNLIYALRVAGNKNPEEIKQVVQHLQAETVHRIQVNDPNNKKIKSYKLRVICHNPSCGNRFMAIMVAAGIALKKNFDVKITIEQKLPKYLHHLLALKTPLTEDGEHVKGSRSLDIIHPYTNTYKIKIYGGGIPARSASIHKQAELKVFIDETVNQYPVRFLYKRDDVVITINNTAEFIQFIYNSYGNLNHTKEASTHTSGWSRALIPVTDGVDADEEEEADQDNGGLEDWNEEMQAQAQDQKNEQPQGETNKLSYSEASQGSLPPLAQDGGKSIVLPEAASSGHKRPAICSPPNKAEKKKKKKEAQRIKKADKNKSAVNQSKQSNMYSFFNPSNKSDTPANDAIIARKNEREKQQTVGEFNLTSSSGQK